VTVLTVLCPSALSPRLVSSSSVADACRDSYDNSGHRLASGPQWNYNQTNIDRTSAVIKQIIGEFASQVNVAPIIAPLNECVLHVHSTSCISDLDHAYVRFQARRLLQLGPAVQGRAILAGLVRQHPVRAHAPAHPCPVTAFLTSHSYPYGTSQQSATVVMIHDAFQPLTTWANFMPPPNFEGVALDTHIYQVFSDAENARSNQAHISNACANGANLAASNAHLWTIVGEWTPAMTDCAKYLNGRGIGARYDGSFDGESAVGSCSGKTGTISQLSSSYKTFLRQMFEAQTSSFERGSGWIMWTWKAESAADWTYQDGLAGGWIPQNPTARQYPNICS
jgi:glucan 1,3-beta-glucosidase